MPRHNYPQTSRPRRRRSAIARDHAEERLRAMSSRRSAARKGRRQITGVADTLDAGNPPTETPL